SRSCMLSLHDARPICGGKDTGAKTETDKTKPTDDTGEQAKPKKAVLAGKATVKGTVTLDGDPGIAKLNTDMIEKINKDGGDNKRSEEHTSELQSPDHL